MGDSYYVRIRGRVNGPFDEKKLAELVQRGQLGRSHEVSLDGYTWSDAGSIAHLFVKPKQTESPQKTIPKAQETGNRAAVLPQPQPPPAEWYYAVDGNRKGPVTWAALQSKASAGEVASTTLVWKQGMTDWLAAADITDLINNSGKSISSSGIGSPNSTSAMSWGELFPVFGVLNDGSWTLAWVQCLAVALLFPLVALEYHGIETLELTWAALTFSLYFSLLWTAFFHWCIDPSRISPWRMAGVWLFTATLGMLGAVIGSMIVMPFLGDFLTNPSEASFLKRFVGWTFGVGLTEESGKLLALLVVASHLKVDKLPRTYCFLGVVSGLAFGTIEAVAYTHGYVAQHENSTDPSSQTYGVLLFLFMLRWLSLPLLHAVWAGLAGYFLGLSYYARHNSWGWVLRGVLIAAVLHGLYDLGAGDESYSWVAIAAAATSLALLVGYLRSEDTMIDRVSSYEPKPANVH
ncbi:GYF domain-containing protein [Bythopirellula goksoeyrii]|uniref:GYF domain-containing protein n=1 Tax=Bythopirellula goksoeyrii TaxID=1400387 RepID=A0A5B9QC82_9BACT|nr:GYF domain-containing protein [Bythopirellula goksoeyrii]QEG35132.1 hypothetical protein Pr1d_24230 [Bythopirellula goksoeyrii]